MTEPLTELERDVLDYVIAYQQRNTYPPSVREIGARLRIRSTRSVSKILGSIAAKGWIERAPSRSRGIRVLDVCRRELALPGGEGGDFEPAVEDDRNWMERALAQADAAVGAAEVPIGAVLVREEQVLAEAHNLTRTRAEPTAHAEMVVIREATERAGESRLLDATLYVTLEPCAMCAGAIVLAKIARLVYAASDPKSGMCGSLGCIVQDRRLNHRVRLTRGVLADDAARLLRTFFQARR